MRYPFFIASILFLAFLYSCNNPAKEPGAVVPEKISIHDSGVAIDYTDTGKGDTVLLFVHGWGINKTYWSDQVDYFSPRYRVITIDLPGYGLSGKNRKDWTVVSFGRDVDSVMEELNLKNVILIGHSMSGNIIVEATTKSPDRVIALVGIDNFKGFGQPQTEQSKKDNAEAIKQLNQNFKQVATEYFNQALFYKTTDSIVRKRVLNDVYNDDSAIAIATMSDNSFDEVTKLVSTKKKLYLINSDVMPTDTAGFVTNKIPYNILYIHATGHYPMIEKPKEFNLLLEKTVSEIGKK